MSDLHPLESLAVIGGAVAAVLATFAPDSRARVTAAWVLLGTVLAAIVAVGLNPPMYAVYLLSLVLAAAAWRASRRLSAAPVRPVWRTGRGSSDERVPEAEGPGSAVVRLLLFLVALALLAVPLGLLPLPADWLAVLPTLPR